VNNEFQRMWKGAVMTTGGTILEFSGGTEENHGTPRLG